MIIIFDVDQVLTESRSPIDMEMAGLLDSLHEKNYLVITSGATFDSICRQVIWHQDLSCGKGMLVFPASATQMYKQTEIGKKSFKIVYEKKMNPLLEQKVKDVLIMILSSMKEEFDSRIYGEIFEMRGGQLTFACLGIEAPLNIKKEWDKDGSKRLKIAKELMRLVPEVEATVGGTTSIDITGKGMNKGYLVTELVKIGVLKKQMLCIADALYEGGNDYPLKLTGIKCIQVKSPDETKKVIRNLLCKNS